MDALDATGGANNGTMPALDMAMLGNMMQAKPITIKIPRFLPYAVDLWQKQCDSTFALHGIHDEHMKYHQVVSSLEPEVLQLARLNASLDF